MRGAALFFLVLSACSQGHADRALILIDGTPAASRELVKSRARAFALKGRPVRVLVAESPAAAVELVARGEGEVALVPEGTPLGDFVTSGRGRDAGRLDADGARLEVLAGNGAMLRTIDGDGAHALAESLLNR